MSSLLHNHTDMSFQDGYSKPIKYLKKASELGLKGLAITEHGNLESAPYIDELSKNFPELKIVFGCELYECFDVKEKDPNNKYFHLIALCRNENGRKGLNKIITKSNFEGFYYKPRVDLEMMIPFANDLVISSACLASKLARENDYNKCIEYVEEYKSIFPYFYLEMQSHDTNEQEVYTQKILQLSHETSTPFIITTDSHAVNESDLYYQARHVQVARDDDTLSESYLGCYMQSDEEIHKIMDKQIGYENVCIGLSNTDDIVENIIEEVHMPFAEPKIPKYPLSDEFSDNYEYLKYLVNKGWNDRKIDLLPKEEVEKRRKRLEYELEIIHKMNYDGYFLIVWDFINWARENKVVVGDGRGSAGGSIVCYLLKISALDPVKYDLIFERFLNPERISLPDIDVDVADRGKVIEYLTNKYGQDHVCQIMNFSEITPVVAIKDVSRILGIPYKVADTIAKKFVFPTFEECMENNRDLIDKYPEYSEMFDIAKHLSGKYRFEGCHAGGVGILDEEVTDIMPMKLGTNGERIIQCNKKMAEKLSIVKFDILGVSTLSVIQDVKDMANIDDWELDPNNDDFINNSEAYSLLGSAKTNGVFQVESQGMKDLLVRLQPNSLEDVSAVLALYRPDSMFMLEDYIHYKHHPEEISYIHPDMEKVTGKTYNAIIYQEEIMDITRVFGGRTYGGADKFRKGVTSKNTEMVHKETETLRTEIIQNGYTKELSDSICELMQRYGGYCFCKAHSTEYAVICLRTAYLKAKYPVEFFCALLNQKRDDYGALNKYIIDAQEFGVEILPPHLNKSDRIFTVQDGKILFGLEAIKGIGEKIVNSLLEERSKGNFKNFQDFTERMSPTNAVVIALVKAGAVPCKDKKSFLLQYASKQFEIKKYTKVSTLPKLSVLREKYGIDIDVIKSKEERLQLYNIEKEKEYNILQKEKYQKSISDFSEKYLQNEKFWEFEALSIFIRNNPFVEAYKYISTSFTDIEEGAKGIIIGVIANIQKKKDRHGKQFAFIWIYSAFGLIEVICWHTQYKEYEDLIKKGNQVAMLCKKSEDKAVIQQMKTYDQWLADRKLSELI